MLSRFRIPGEITAVAAAIRRFEWSDFVAVCVAGGSSWALSDYTKPGTAFDIIVPVVCTACLAVSLIKTSWFGILYVLSCFYLIADRLS